MAKGKWVKGNGFRPVNCKGCPVAAAPQSGGLCPWPLWNKWKFPFAPSVPFRPASGSWWVLVLDVSRAGAAVRAFLKKFKILNLEGL